MAKETYDPFAFSPLGERIAGGANAYRQEGNPNSGYLMNIFWFNPVTGEKGQTTEGWSRVPDEHKPYVYRDARSRNEAENTFYQSGALFGGTNLAGGQGTGGGLLSGQAYAQQIAGGIPFEQVVAPGMSFSPDQPMGFLAEGATPFVPRSITPPETTQQETTFFPSVSDSNVGMTGADLGLPMGTGTPMPAGTLFDETSVTSMPATLPEPMMPVMPMVQPMMPVIEPEIPVSIPTTQPEIPVSLPVIEPVARELPVIPDIPVNLGFPTVPVQPILEREPVIPTMPVMTNFTVPQDPILNIENIISPIRTGGTRRLLGTL